MSPLKEEVTLSMTQIVIPGMSGDGVIREPMVGCPKPLITYIPPRRQRESSVCPVV